ncbi:MAG: hypothetical protein AB8B99_00125 [Phormidesmis sp.]
MLPNSIHNQDLGNGLEGNMPARNVSDALKAMFQRLELSDDQRQLAVKYHTVSMQPTLSEQDTTFLIHVWETAEDDVRLAEALSFVDGLMPYSLEGQALVSENKDVRTYLSEHVVILAEEKLKARRGTYNNLSANSPHVTMVCPDGSGIVNKCLHQGRYIRLDGRELDDEVCDRCHAKLSEHVKFISAESIGGAVSHSAFNLDQENREDKETMPG